MLLYTVYFRDNYDGAIPVKRRRESFGRCATRFTHTYVFIKLCNRKHDQLSDEENDDTSGRKV